MSELAPYFLCRIRGFKSERRDVKDRRIIEKGGEVWLRSERRQTAASRS